MKLSEWRCPETKEYYDAFVISTTTKSRIAQLSNHINSSTCQINKYSNHFEIPLNDLEEDNINQYPNWLHSKLLKAMNKAELLIIKVKR